MSAAPTHRKGSMPKNGGPMRQRVSHHGTKPVIVPGARMKNTSDPTEAQKRRMVHPPMNARHGSARTGYTLAEGDAKPITPSLLRALTPITLVAQGRRCCTRGVIHGCYTIAAEQEVLCAYASSARF